MTLAHSLAHAMRHVALALTTLAALPAVDRIVGPGGFSTLEAAMRAALPGDRILLRVDVPFVNSFPALPNDVTIESDAGQPRHFIRLADFLGPVDWTISGSVTFRNVELQVFDPDDLNTRRPLNIQAPGATVLFEDVRVTEVFIGGSGSLPFSSGNTFELVRITADRVTMRRTTIEGVDGEIVSCGCNVPRGTDALIVTAAMLELEDVTLRAGNAPITCEGGFGVGRGGIALQANTGATELVRTSLFDGNGGHEQTFSGRVNPSPAGVSSLGPLCGVVASNRRLGLDGSDPRVPGGRGASVAISATPVDRIVGPGGFSDLPSAIMAACPGDRILIDVDLPVAFPSTMPALPADCTIESRPGGVRRTIGLRRQAPFSSYFSDTWNIDVGVTIRNLRIETQDPFGVVSTGLEIDAAGQSVVLEDVVVQETLGPGRLGSSSGSGSPAVTIVAGDVRLTRTDILTLDAQHYFSYLGQAQGGADALRVTADNLVLEDVTLRGGDAPVVGRYEFLMRAGSALVATTQSTTLTRCQLSDGNGGWRDGGPSGQFLGPRQRFAPAGCSRLGTLTAVTSSTLQSGLDGSDPAVPGSRGAARAIALPPWSQIDRVLPSQPNGGGFGRALAVVGDVDGDDYDDYAIGQARANGDAGYVRVVSGRTHQLLMEHVSCCAGLQLGASLAGGDFTGSGRSDVIAGSPGAGAGVFFLATDCGWSMPGDPGCQGWLVQPTGSTRIGHFVATAQLTADSNVDFLHTEAMAGGPVDTLVAGTWENSGYRELWRVTPRPGESISALVAVPDNDDGVDDIALGYDAAMSGRGVVLLRSGRDGGAMNQAVGEPGEGLGSALAVVGDVDGDRSAEVAVASAEWSGSMGRVQIWSGTTGQMLSQVTTDFGPITLASTGDFDGDGVRDVLVCDGSKQVKVRSAAHLATPLQGFPSVYGFRFRDPGVAMASIDSSGDSVADFLIENQAGDGSVEWFDTPPRANPPRVTRYGDSCPDSAGRLARVDSDSAPRVGGAPIVLRYFGGRPNATSFLRFGVRRRVFNYGVFGAPECFSLIDSFAGQNVVLNGAGWAELTLRAPSTLDWLNIPIVAQHWVIDPGITSRLSFTSSSAVEIEFGMP